MTDCARCLCDHGEFTKEIHAAERSIRRWLKAELFRKLAPVDMTNKKRPVQLKKRFTEQPVRQFDRPRSGLENFGSVL